MAFFIFWWLVVVAFVVVIFRFFSRSLEKEDKPLAGSLTAGCLAVGAALLAWYSADTANKESKIRAAVSLSNAYFQPDIQRRYSLLQDNIAAKKIDPKTSMEVRSFVDTLDYIAYLANRREINNDYVSWRIKCDMYYVVRFAPSDTNLESAMRDMKEYIKSGKDAACPERAK